MHPFSVENSCTIEPICNCFCKVTVYYFDGSSQLRIFYLIQSGHLGATAAPPVEWEVASDLAAGDSLVFIFP